MQKNASGQANAFSMISRCPARNVSCPKYCLSACSIFSKVKRAPYSIYVSLMIHHNNTVLVRKMGTFMPELHHYAINALRLAALHLSYWLASQGLRVFNHIEPGEERGGSGPVSC